MVNDNTGGTGAIRLPSARGLALSLSAGWQRLLTVRTIRPDAVLPRGELRAAIADYRSALIGIAVASGLINLLSLTGPIFMLQVYDRVLPSRSVPTLLGLALLALVLFGFRACSTCCGAHPGAHRARARSKILAARVSTSSRGCRCAAAPPATACSPCATSTSVRSFMSGAGPDGFFRSALDAALRRGLLSVPSAGWAFAALIGAG